MTKWTPIDGRYFSTPDDIMVAVHGVDFSGWKPSGLVLHNTGAPTLAQWLSSPKAAHQLDREKQRIANLEYFFKVTRGWSAGPHAFVGPDRVWFFTPFNKPGVHSPSWNGTRIGIELIGDYDREDKDAGEGAKAYRNAVILFACLHSKLGIDPDTIKFHKDDPATTHKDCPGKDIDKARFIRDVQEYMGSAGDYHGAPETPPYFKDAPQAVAVVNTPGDTLNVRDVASARGKILRALPHGEHVRVLDTSMNGATMWAYIDYGQQGWVAARYLKTGV